MGECNTILSAYTLYAYQWVSATLSLVPILCILCIGTKDSVARTHRYARTINYMSQNFLLFVNYSITCIQRSLNGSNERGLL